MFNSKKKIQKNNKKYKKNKKNETNIDQEQEKTLEMIYGQKQIDLTKLEHKKNWYRPVLYVLFFLLALFLGLSIISYLVFNRDNKFSGDAVKFEVSAVDRAKSGEKIEYIITYANLEKVPFRKAEIDVRYPSGFVFLNSTPAPVSKEKNIWKLGAIPEGKSGQIKIEGIIYGDMEQEQTLTSTFFYWPANFSSEFQEVASSSIKIIDTSLNVVVEGPEQVLVGEKTEYIIRYKNYSSENLSNVRFRIIYPESFVVESLFPDIYDDKEIIDIDKLASREEGKIIIRGFYNSQSAGIAQLKVDSQIKVNNIYYKQSNYSFDTNVIKGDLSVNLIVNGDYQKNIFAQMGDVLNFAIVYKNISTQPLKDLVIKTYFDSLYGDKEKSPESLLDWSSLNVAYDYELEKNVGENGSYQDVLVWSKKNIKQLEELDPGKEYRIDFQIRLKKKDQLNKVIEHYLKEISLKSRVAVEIGKIGDIESSVKIISNEINFLINSDTQFEAWGNYFDKDGYPVGTGPMPPRVGQTTSYIIHWQINNTLHSLDDIIVTSKLPEYVVWGGKKEASTGELTFNQETRTITWKINKMPDVVNQLNVSFIVNLVPEKKHLNKTAVILERTSFTAIDSYTNGKIIRKTSAITTGNLKDDFAKDKGIIEDNSIDNFDNAASGNINDIFSSFRSQ